MRRERPQTTLPVPTLLPGRAVCERQQISGPTLDRRVNDPDLGFPAPVWIQGRRYWRIADLERWEAGLPTKDDARQNRARELGKIGRAEQQRRRDAASEPAEVA